MGTPFLVLLILQGGKVSDIYAWQCQDFFKGKAWRKKYTYLFIYLFIYYILHQEAWIINLCVL